MPFDASSRRALGFAATYDYRCPFARNLHEHVVLGLEGGAPWDVRFVPFSLHQVHVGDDAFDVWDDPGKAPDLMAMVVGLAVRDLWPERFLGLHRSLFEARHDEGLDLRSESVLAQMLEGGGLDPAAVFAEVRGGAPLESFRKEHGWAASEHGVFGVPTIVVGAQAAFMRLMHRPRGDVEVAVTTVERVVDLVAGWADLNELKHTTIPR